MFKPGQLVKILYVPMVGKLGIIIKQGTDPVDGAGLNISNAEWLVHLTDGQEIWLMSHEMTNV